MSVIQEVPAGLLALLGIRTTGRNPDQLASVVSCVMDVLDQYAVIRREGITSAGVVPVANGFSGALVTVPAGELWYVESMFCVGLVVAAESSAFYAQHRDAADSSIRFGDLGSTSAFPGGVTRNVISSIRERFWAKAGDQFGFYLTQTGGFTSTYQMQIEFLRLSI